MKRISILVLLAMVVTMTSVANSFIPENQVKAEIVEKEFSSAKPVMVPYLNMTVSEFAELRKEKKYANRLGEGNLQRITKVKPLAGVSEQDTNEYSGGDSEAAEETDRGSEGIRIGASSEGGLNDQEAGAEEEYPEVEEETYQDEGRAGDDISDGDSEVFDESDGDSTSVWDELDPGEGSSSEYGVRGVYLGEWTITAYCPCTACCGEWATGCTASGTPAIAGHTVACNILPFGTIVAIDGVEYTVEDTGYSPYGDAWIDIFFDTHEEALAYGEKVREVYLVEWGDNN